MKTVYLLFDETAEGDYPIGIYSSIELATAARETLRHKSEAQIKEFTVDDPLTHNGRYIVEVA